MRRRVSMTVSLLFCIFPILISAAPDRRESRPSPDIPLRNWIPATASHPPVVEENGVAAMALPSNASHFIALNPCRVVDTRRPDGAHGGPIVTGGVSRAFNMPAGPCSGVPAAAAYSLNISVTGSASGAAQFLTAYPAGTTRPVAATMNFDGGETTSNSALVPADGTGSIEIYVSASSHVIIDINGYVQEGVVTSVAAGSGLSGGGTGPVTVGIASGGVGATHLGPGAVTTGALEDGAVTGTKIANGHLVREINGVKDLVTIQASGGSSVSTIGSTITIDTPAAVPSGTMILGDPGDTTLIGAGYTEIAASREDYWRATTLTGAPSPRGVHSAIWTGTRMFIWGGTTAMLTPLGDGALYDPLTDSWNAVTGTGAPTARLSHSTVWTGTEIIIWGGSDGTPLNTGARYNPVANSWSPVSIVGAPAGRAFHVAVWTGSRMIVWGGYDVAVLNTGGQYDPSANAWSLTTLTNAPAPRYLHTAVWTGTKMIVWGGYDEVTRFNTGGLYDPAGDVWTATSPTGAPSGRKDHTAVWTGSKMIVWGGDGPGIENTGGLFDPSTNSWSSTAASGGPAGRYSHTAVWTGSMMIVWGGFSNSGLENTGGAYDPALNSWTSVTTRNGAPAARLAHSAVWTGSNMIVWGGSIGSAVTNTGGRWAQLSLYRKN